MSTKNAPSYEHSERASTPSSTLLEPNRSKVPSRKRRRLSPEDEKAVIQFLKRLENKENHATTHLSPALSPMDHFFKSISGEFENMTESELTYFKSEYLQIIHRIKSRRSVSLDTP